MRAKVFRQWLRIVFGLLVARLLCIRPKAADEPHPRAARLLPYALALLLLTGWAAAEAPRRS